MESHGAVGLSVGQSVGRSVGISQSVVISQSEGKKRIYSSRLIMRKIDIRKNKAEGFINARKCKDTRRRPIYTNTLLVLKILYYWR